MDAQEITCVIRWMIRRDLEEVLEIEQASFSHPWTEEQFLEALRQRNCIGIAAEIKKKVVGFVLYELHKHLIVITNLAVRPEWRRMSVGRSLIEKLIGKLSAQRRARIVLEIADSNLDGQLFFRQMGFRATKVVRDAFGDEYGGGDAYRMELWMARECGGDER